MITCISKEIGSFSPNFKMSFDQDNMTKISCKSTLQESAFESAESANSRKRKFIFLLVLSNPNDFHSGQAKEIFDNCSKDISPTTCNRYSSIWQK